MLEKLGFHFRACRVKRGLRDRQICIIRRLLMDKLLAVVSRLLLLGATLLALPLLVYANHAFSAPSFAWRTNSLIFGCPAV
jgi:hypothetical protein